MIKTIFMGTPDFAVPILKTLIAETELVLVVSQPDKLTGRKKILTAPPVKEYALQSNIPVFQPKRIKHDYEIIKEYKPDLIVTCAYGQILPKEVLEIPALGCINVHASLLPKYRGGAPIHHAIMNGENETGITIMYMDEGMDTGDMIAKFSLKIEADDTTDSLHDKLSILGGKALSEVLPSIIAKTNNRVKQNNNEATYAPIITREVEHIDFNSKAIDIHNKVRGLFSHPCANFTLDNEEVKVLEGYIGSDATTMPGTIEAITKDAIGVSTIDKIYYITKLKPFGKKTMTTKDYLNGIKKEELLNKKVS